MTKEPRLVCSRFERSDTDKKVCKHSFYDPCEWVERVYCDITNQRCLLE